MQGAKSGSRPGTSDEVPSQPMEPVERRTTAERVERLLRDEILRGRWAPGEKLPPERELSTTLGVTRVTLRSALARLAAAGMVSTVQGDGHRVRDLRLTGGLERLPAMIEAWENDPVRVESLVRDLLGLRRAVMAEACAYAATLDASERAGLAVQLERMEAVASDVEAFARADLDFTRALMRMSQNLAFELTFNTVASFAEEHPELMRVLWEDPEMQLRGARSLLLLLDTGDAELVRSTVRNALAALDELCLVKVRAALDARVPGTRARRPPRKVRGRAAD